MTAITLPQGRRRVGGDGRSPGIVGGSIYGRRMAGYTDDVGNPNFNLKLSVARAQAVRDWLIDASGIPATQFAIQGYGETRSVASNDTAEGRARNRRVEITLVPDALK